MLRKKDLLKVSLIVDFKNFQNIVKAEKTIDWTFYDPKLYLI